MPSFVAWRSIKGSHQAESAAGTRRILQCGMSSTDLEQISALSPVDCFRFSPISLFNDLIRSRIRGIVRYWKFALVAWGGHGHDHEGRAGAVSSD